MHMMSASHCPSKPLTIHGSLTTANHQKLFPFLDGHGRCMCMCLCAPFPVDVRTQEVPANTYEGHIVVIRNFKRSGSRWELRRRQNDHDMKPHFHGILKATAKPQIVHTSQQQKRCGSSTSAAHFWPLRQATVLFCLYHTWYVIDNGILPTQSPNNP